MISRDPDILEFRDLAEDLNAYASIKMRTSMEEKLQAQVVVWCACNMAPSPAIQSYLVQTAPESSDIQLSFNTSSLHIGVAGGSIVGGLIVNHYSVITNAWVGGLIVILAIISAIFSMNKTKSIDRSSKIFKFE